jgi:hypothetical protein
MYIKKTFDKVGGYLVQEWPLNVYYMSYRCGQYDRQSEDVRIKE